MHDAKLWINAGAVSHLLSVVDQLDLSPTEMAVLLQHAYMAQVGSLETWCAHDTLRARTKLGLTAVKAAVKRLQQAGLLRFVRHRRNGIKLYALNLPGLAPSASPAKTAEPVSKVYATPVPKTATADPRFASAI